MLGYLLPNDVFMFFERKKDEHGFVEMLVLSADHLPENHKVIAEDYDEGKMIFSLRTKKVEVIDAFIKELERHKAALLV